MSSVLDRWPYSRRSLWVVLGAAAAVVVAIVVLVVVVTGGNGSAPTATSPASGEVDEELPPPTPIPVETVEPGPAPSAVVTVPPIGDKVVTAGPAEDATDAGVTVRLVSLRPITTQAYERGDATGPGLAVTIVVTNNSTTELPLAADIGLSNGADTPPTPGLPMDLDGHNSPFGKETLAPGESAERTAVFATPNAAGTPVAVQVLIGDSNFSLQATVGS